MQEIGTNDYGISTTNIYDVFDGNNLIWYFVNTYYLIVSKISPYIILQLSCYKKVLLKSTSYVYLHNIPGFYRHSEDDKATKRIYNQAGVLLTGFCFSI